MPRDFFHATAEQTVAAVEAVQAKGEATVDFVEKFCDLPQLQATQALSLAQDLGLLRLQANIFRPNSPLTRFIGTSEDKQKVSVFRIVLESYEPFIVFRNRLSTTCSIDMAAQQTKVLLDLSAHREEIKDTLISLGTYANALQTLGGGRYIATGESVANYLIAVAAACDDAASHEEHIRVELGGVVDRVSRNDVLIPLSTALLKARSGTPADAVTDAAKAVESFLAELAARKGVSLVGSAGLGQKIEKFRSVALPKKIVEAGKYLVQVRNAADHGRDVDPDVNAVWIIQPKTATNYVYVAVRFIVSCCEWELNNAFML